MALAIRSGTRLFLPGPRMVNIILSGTCHLTTSFWFYEYFYFLLLHSSLEPVFSSPPTLPLAACSPHGTTTNDSSLSASGACPSGVVMTLVGVGSILVLVNGIQYNPCPACLGPLSKSVLKSQVKSYSSNTTAQEKLLVDS